MAAQLLIGGIEAGFSIKTKGAILWEDTLGSKTIDPLTGVGSDLVKFLFCRVIGKIKYKLGASLYSGRDPEARRSILAYIEATFGAKANIITSTWQDKAISPPYDIVNYMNKTIDMQIEELKLKLKQPADVKTVADLVTYCKENERSVLNDYLTAQFTFIVALAKKGDATRSFNTKTASAIRKELDLQQLDLYAEELSWLSEFVVRRIGLKTNDEWSQLFKLLITNAPEVERVRTLCSWAVSVGVTKMTIVKTAYLKYPDFPWKIVAKMHPAQLKAAEMMYTTHKGTPYRAFYDAAVKPDWPCTSFQQLARLCLLLLTTDGQGSLNGYRGLENVDLPNQARWSTEIRKYLDKRSSDSFAGVDSSPGHVAEAAFN